MAKTLRKRRPSFRGTALEESPGKGEPDVMPFGKYAGMPTDVVPVEYQWGMGDMVVQRIIRAERTVPEWSDDEMTPDLMHFGRYAGMPVDDVPTEYHLGCIDIMFETIEGAEDRF